MAWQPSKYLIEGFLDNTTPGQVTGWMNFVGMKETVELYLAGNFHRDIRGAKIKLSGDGETAGAAGCMERFGVIQTGKVGNMTAGLPPADYADWPYFEWYSMQNGRIVIELQSEQVQVLTRPILACESDPICRAEQARNIVNWLGRFSRCRWRQHRPDFGGTR